MSVDPKSDRPQYKQLADILRDQITRRELPPGSRVPGEDVLAREYRLGRETVRQAVAILRREGLITTARGRGTWVRAEPARTPVRIGRGDRVVTRMPIGTERHDLGLSEGVPIFEITRTDGTVEQHPCDRVELVMARRVNGQI